MSEERTHEPATELVALRLLPTAVRGRQLDGGLVTYRKVLTAIVPGQRLTVAVARRWRFRHTDIMGGALLHVGFSLRALTRAGFELPALDEAACVVCPGAGDERLLDSQLALAHDDWLRARCLLLDVLEDRPGCLVAHASLGEIHAALHQRDHAAAHFTAAVRLGLGATGQLGAGDWVDPRTPGGRALIRALLGRAELSVAAGQRGSAARDLRHSLALDFEDQAGAGPRLQRLEALTLRPAGPVPARDDSDGHARP